MNNNTVTTKETTTSETNSKVTLLKNTVTNTKGAIISLQIEEYSNKISQIRDAYSDSLFASNEYRALGNPMSEANQKRLNEYTGEIEKLLSQYEDHLLNLLDNNFPYDDEDFRENESQYADIYRALEDAGIISVPKKFKVNPQQCYLQTLCYLRSIPTENSHEFCLMSIVAAATRKNWKERSNDIKNVTSLIQKEMTKAEIETLKSINAEIGAELVKLLSKTNWFDKCEEPEILRLKEKFQE